MNILIAGGAGFIGSHLADELLKANNVVICIDNLCQGSEELIRHNYTNSNFVFCNCDICKRDTLDELFTKYNFTRVYHLAANSDIQKGGKDPSIDFHNTFSTTVSLLDAMHKHDVKELLFASTSAVYGDKKDLLSEITGDLKPISYYGGAKLASEAFISAYTAMKELKTTVIRFPNVVGRRLTHGVIFDFVNKLRRDSSELEILGDGQQEKPYIYVDDLVNAITSIDFNTGMSVYNVGVDTSTNVTRIADIVCEEMGLENVRYKYTGGSIGWKGDVAKFKYDLSKIHATGWRARYTSDEAVRLAARYAIEH